MPRTYDAEKYRAYAQSESGRAARAKAHARYIDSRRNPAPWSPAPRDTATLTEAFSEWRRK